MSEQELADIKLAWKKYGDELRAQGLSYERYIRQWTGWTHDQFVAWCANGRMPSE